jgi:hypothetical protein
LNRLVRIALGVTLIAMFWPPAQTKTGARR